MRHGKRERGRDGRIDGISAPGEDARAGITGGRRHADDQAIPGWNACILLRGEGLREEKNSEQNRDDFSVHMVSLLGFDGIRGTGIVIIPESVEVACPFA
jgi:hypothetical protein